MKLLIANYLSLLNEVPVCVCMCTRLKGATNDREICMLCMFRVCVCMSFDVENVQNGIEKMEMLKMTIYTTTPPHLVRHFVNIVA